MSDIYKAWTFIYNISTYQHFWLTLLGTKTLLASNCYLIPRSNPYATKNIWIVETNPIWESTLSPSFLLLSHLISWDAFVSDILEKYSGSSGALLEKHLALRENRHNQTEMFQSDI